MKPPPAAWLIALAALVAGCASTNERGVIIDRGVWPFGATAPAGASPPAFNAAPETPVMPTPSTPAINV